MTEPVRALKIVIADDDAVTRGALQKLNRDQLQGVIAHEFSHILNGDIRISVRLMGLVFGLMAPAQPETGVSITVSVRARATFGPSSSDSTRMSTAPVPSPR